MPHYPVFLDLRGRPCMVIGGGHLAEEKVRGLLAVEAVVTVIAPELTPDLAALVEKGNLRHHPRDYQPGDLKGVSLVISCGQTPEMAEAIWQEALRRNALINTLDDVPHCRFIAPSIVRRGDLAIAISTGGKAPVLAVRLRQWLEAQLGEEYGRFLSLAGSVRGALAQRWPDFATRRELWYRLVDSDVLDLLRKGDEAEAAGRFREILGVEVEQKDEERRAADAGPSPPDPLSHTSSRRPGEGAPPPKGSQPEREGVPPLPGGCECVWERGLGGEGPGEAGLFALGAEGEAA